MGIVRDYVTKYMFLILTVVGILEEDKLHNFVSDLKPWVLWIKEAEYYRFERNIIAAKALADFPFERSIRK